MIKCFDKIAVLTSQNPDAFLNFIGNGDASLVFVIRPDASLPQDSLYINGIEANTYLTASEGYNLLCNKDVSAASFHLYTRDLEDFNYSIKIDSSGYFQLINNWTAYGAKIEPLNPTLGNSILYGEINNNPNIASNYIASNIFYPQNDSSLYIEVDVSLYQYGIMPKFFIIESSTGTKTTEFILNEGNNVLNYYFENQNNSIYFKFDQSINSLPLNSIFKARAIVQQYSSYVYDVSVINRQHIISPEDINIFETSQVQADNETSYLVLRTNPKFTGNIKIIADNSDNIFLDTFKVSDILNNKMYRRQKVSSESVLSGDIRRVFSSLPIGEIYRIDQEDTLNVSFPKTDYNYQYNLNYSYGARLFLDELYKEDYSLLAPIWINSTIPDYFAVFKLNGVYNTETYLNEDLSQLAAKYFKEANIIKSWGLKENTPLGNYLRNHLNELQNARAPLFLSLSNPDTTKDPDPNTWYGIAVDKGIVTGRSETTYNFDKTANFTDINAFVSHGFDRLKLLCPNLLNMEFIFDDNDASTYSMNRYFGLYLTDNELYRVSFYAENQDSSITILSLDEKDSSVFFNSSIFESDTGEIKEIYKNRIFTLNDKQTIKRITNKKNISGEDINFISSWINKPGEQLFEVSVEEKTTNKFLTFKLNVDLHQGEHLRVVDKTNYVIWEVIGVDSSLMAAGECWPYCALHDINPDYPKVYRTVYSSLGDKTDQIIAIKKAFDTFSNYENTPFKTSNLKEQYGQLSLEIYDDYNSNDIWFQRLTSQTLNDVTDPSTEFNSSADYSDINFYGVLDPSLSDFERISFDASYGPIGTEIYGDRMSLFINFIDTGTNKIYSFSDSANYKFEDYMMYVSEDGRYRLISPFEITTTSLKTYNYVTDPHESDNNSIIQTKNSLFTVNGKWFAYNTYPLSVSLMGINPVKDMDYVVYDSSLGFESDYSYNRWDDSSTYFLKIEKDSSAIITPRNSYKIISGNGTITINGDAQNFYTSDSSVFKFNTFFGEALIQPYGIPVMVTYDQIQSNKTYSSFNITPENSEESINNYYLSSSKERLKYGLTVPHITKWATLGDDCRGNELRLNVMLNNQIYDTSSNFIPFEEYYKGEISYPVFKYLDSGDKAWKSYIYYDVNDVIQYTEDGSTLFTTFKNLMFDKPYIDIFSKLVYSNHDVNSIKLRSSIVYYNNYKNSIDTIINGINLSMTLDDNSKSILDIKDWNNFRISMISSPSRNRDNNYPIEVIVNENTGTILIIWYQGSDNLHYTKRYGLTFNGKSVLKEDSSLNFWYHSFNETDSRWNFVKSPYYVNFASLSTDIINIYSSYSATYDSSLCSMMSQINWNILNPIYSVFNAYNENAIIYSSFQFFSKQYNTFKGYVDYSYLRNVDTYGDEIINYSYLYGRNTNIYKDTTCEIDVLKYLTNINRIGYYIIREDKIFNNNNFLSPPIIINIKDPRLYKNIYTYGGWYKPKFNNILDFTFTEDGSIIEIVEKDFILANTNLKQYNHIPQLWYNKVITNISGYDTSIKNAINFTRNFNVFKAQWDADYYTLENYNETKTKIDGYNASQELPSYFGSKLIKLPESINLDEWDLNMTNVIAGVNQYTLEYNLTRKIIDIFTSSEDFTNNWIGLTSLDSIINNYIKTTIIGYYNISKNKITVEMWTKPYDGNIISMALDDSFTQDFAANIDANLVYVNNEYIYKIKVNTLPSLTYFFKFKLFEK